MQQLKCSGRYDKKEEKMHMKKLIMAALVALASGLSPAQLSNYGTAPRIIRSWEWNTCLYTLFEVDGHEYLQVLVRHSNAISLIHHAGCPCMEKR